MTAASCPRCRGNDDEASTCRPAGHAVRAGANAGWGARGPHAWECRVSPVYRHGGVTARTGRGVPIPGRPIPYDRGAATGHHRYSADPETVRLPCGPAPLGLLDTVSLHWTSALAPAGYRPGKLTAAAGLNVTGIARPSAGNARNCVECKRYRRRVAIGDVDQFVGKLIDVGADQGILYSPRVISTPATEPIASTSIWRIAPLRRPFTCLL